MNKGRSEVTRNKYVKQKHEIERKRLKYAE